MARQVLCLNSFTLRAVGWLSSFNLIMLTALWGSRLNANVIKEVMNFSK